MKFFGSFLLLLIFFFNPNAFAGSSDSFEKLKSLKGKWQGTARWLSKPDSEFELTAVYSLTGRGTAVVEDLIVEGETTMTSVYHLDGNALRMTHFCGAGNQPRLKASTYDDPDKIAFQIVDVTNLSSPGAAHVVGAEIIFKSESEITLSFDFDRNGKTDKEVIQLRRID